MFEALPRRPRPSCAEHFAALKITKTSTSLKNRIKELRFHSLESVSVRLAGVQYAFKVAQGPWGGPTFLNLLDYFQLFLNYRVRVLGLGFYGLGLGLGF